MGQASAERAKGWGTSLDAEAPLFSSSGPSYPFLHSGYFCSLTVLRHHARGTCLSSTPSCPLPQSYSLLREAPVPCLPSHSPGSTFLTNHRATDHSPGTTGALAGAVEAQMGQEDGPSHTDCKMLTFAREMRGRLSSRLTFVNEQLSRGRETIAYGSSYISRAVNTKN